MTTCRRARTHRAVAAQRRPHDRVDRRDAGRRAARHGVPRQLLQDGEPLRRVITRVVDTEEGIVGEAYAGDEDATLARDRRRHPGRDRAAAHRRERVRLRALLGARATPSRTTSCATGASGSWRSPASTSRSGTRSARRSGSRSGRLWGGYRDRIPVNIIGGYYGRDLAEHSRRGDGVARAGLRAAASSRSAA